MVSPTALAEVDASVTVHSAPLGAVKLEADCVWYCLPLKDTVTVSAAFAVQPQNAAGWSRWSTMLELKTELTVTCGGGAGGGLPLQAPDW